MKANIPAIPGTLSRAWLPLLTWLLSFAVAAIASAQSYPVDANGWSVITPSADSRLIYVSATGDDATAQAYSVAQVGSDPRNPLIAVNAYRTLAAARAQMRIGFPDWMLIKRGDTFTDTVSLGGQFLSGRSGTERMVFTYYGVSGNRPLLTGANWLANSQGTGNFAIVGLEVYYRERDPASPYFVSFATKRSAILRVIDSQTGNILVEDCIFRHGRDNITLDLAAPPLFAANIDIRRSAVWDAHDDTTAGTDAQPDRSQGIFVNGANNLKIEDSFFDHNGWSVDAAGNLAGRGRAFYSHNIYLQNGSNNTTVSGTIISRAASVGVQARAGNYLTDNLFIRNAIGGFSAANSSEVGEGAINEVVNNVLIASDDHLPTTWPEAQGGNRGTGLEVKRTDQGLYQGNILLDEASIGEYSFALYGEAGTGSQLVRVWNNIVRNWKAGNGQSFHALDPAQYDLQNNIVDGVDLSTNSAVLFTDGLRTLSTYLTSVGSAGDDAAFLANARAAWLGAPRSFPTAYRATTVNNYFRQGFTIVGTSELPGVTVAPGTVQLELGGTRQFNAVVSPTGANQAVTWSSGNPAVATVNASGLVTATGLGVATITATSVEGGYTGSGNVSVSPVGGISIPFADETVTVDGEADATYSSALGVISKPEATAPVPGTSDIAGTWRARFDATNLYLHVEVSDNVWNNDNPNYWHNDGLEIFFDGNNSKGSTPDGIDDLKIAFTPQANGTVLITTNVFPPNPAGANFSGVQAAYVLRNAGGGYQGYGLEVQVPFSLLGGTPAEGRQIGLDFQLNDNDTGGDRDRAVTWYGSALNSHPFAYGTATLGAAVGAIDVTGVSVSPAATTIMVGATQQLTATVSPAGATNTAVSWMSNNPAVATVSSTGLVTALAAGDATITVTTQDGSFFAGSVVTVPIPAGTATNVAAVLTPLTRKPAAGTPVYDSGNSDFPGALYHTGAHDYRSGLFIFRLPAVGAQITSVTFNAYYQSVGTGYSVSLFGHDLLADVTTLPPATTYWGYGPAAGQPGTELKANFVGTGAAVNNVGWVSTDVTDFVRGNYVAGQYVVLRVGSTFNAPTDVASEPLHPTSRAYFAGGPSSAASNQMPYLTIATAGASLPVTGVSVNQSVASLFVGDSQQLSATVAPGNATNQAVTWASNNPAVATVSASGLVTAVAAGNAIVTVTTVDGGFTATTGISVTVPIPGGTATNVLAALTPQTRKPAAGTPIYDSPSNNDNPGAMYHTGAHDYRSGLFIFQLPPVSGEITEVTFNAYYKSVGTGYSVSLFGHDPIASIQALPAATTYWGYGPASAQPGTELKANFVGTGAASNAIGWVSTDVTAFIRDHYVAGQYIVLRVGSTFDAPTDVAGEPLHPTSRAAFDGGTSAATNNRVPFLSITTAGANIPVTGVSVSPDVAALMVGGTQQLTADVAPANASNPSVTWSSSNPAVATVSASGLVTAVSAGSATVTATTDDGDFTATSTITVNSSMIAVTGVSVSPTVASVAIGATQQLAATVTPANATNPGVTWSSDNPAVATVSSSGLVTAISSGDATITVTTQSGGFVANAEITVPALSATVTLGNLSQTYDGSPRAVSVTTDPSGLAVAITYDGSTTAPTDAGSYSVVAEITDSGYTGVATDTLVIAPAFVALTLEGLEQRYDGAPKIVTATTTPENLAVTITYDGAATPPWTSGAHAVEATIDDPNYTGAATDTLLIVPTAFVRRAPTLSGGVDGSVHQLTGENLTLSGNTWISGDLLVPGAPTVQVNVPTYVSTLDGTGETLPTGYAVTLNPDAVVRHVVRRAAAFVLDPVAPPAAPTGTRNVTLTAPGQNPGDFATLRNLTLAGAAGSVALPAGSYGNITLNGGGTLVLGVEGATEPAVYDFQLLTVNPLLVGTGRIEIAGPVLVTVAGNAMLFGSAGNAAHPEWLKLRSAGGGISTNGLAQVYGHLFAPNGAVNLLGGSKVIGLVRADRLTIAPNALLEDPAPIADDDGLPSPWLAQDIGAVGATGTAVHASGTFTVEGSGADIWGPGDEFRYVFQSASGDCTIVARVTGVENTDTWAKVGVMIRDTLNADSAYAFTSMSPAGGGTAMFAARLSAGTNTSSAVQSTQTVPRWVRVVRTGNTFTGSYSDDGTTWTLLNSVTIAMGSNVHIGLAVTSHNDGTLCTGNFTNVTATP